MTDLKKKSTNIKFVQWELSCSMQTDVMKLMWLFVVLQMLLKTQASVIAWMQQYHMTVPLVVCWENSEVFCATPLHWHASKE